MTEEQIQEQFPDHQIEHFDVWSTYEENGWICVLSKGTDYFVLNGGHSVMADPAEEPEPLELWPVSQEQALRDMMQFDEAAREIDQMMEGGF